MLRERERERELELRKVEERLQVSSAGWRIPSEESKTERKREEAKEKRHDQQKTAAEE